jgi:hypothetical protein
MGRGVLFYLVSCSSVVYYVSCTWVYAQNHHCLQVKNWVKELKKMLGSDICLVIAGNKIDLEKQRTVPVVEAEE